jgi:lipoyl(octanoyl) transferase
MSEPLRVKSWGMVEYTPTWAAMQALTSQRDEHTPDELWLLEHPPVFTQGLNGKAEHILNPGPIPVVAIDRGGQVTYHGPGQLVAYPLWDLKRLQLGVRDLVVGIEQIIIATLKDFGMDANGRRDAPGVYVGDAKIASIGLRIRRQACYHGLALNVNMDLSPFTRINPCGFSQLRVVDMQTLGVNTSVAAVSERLLTHACAWHAELQRRAR